MNGKMCDSRDEERMNGSFHFISTFKSGHIDQPLLQLFPFLKKFSKKFSIKMYSI